MGIVVTATNRITGYPVTVGRAADIGIDAESLAPWATVCEKHSTFILSATRGLAVAAKTFTFCDTCREEFPEGVAPAPKPRSTRRVLKPSRYGNSSAVEEGRVEIEKTEGDDEYARKYYHSNYNVYLDGKKIGVVYSEETTETRTYSGTVIGYSLKPSVTWSYEALTHKNNPYPGFSRQTRNDAVTALLRTIGGVGF